MHREISIIIIGKTFSHNKARPTVEGRESIQRNDKNFKTSCQPNINLVSGAKLLAGAKEAVLVKP